MTEESPRIIMRGKLTNRYKLVALATSLYLTSLSVSAVPITFTHTGSGAGTIGGVGFATNDFVITASGDTDDRSPIVNGFSIAHINASIAITNVGTFDFISGTRTFINNNENIIGFSSTGIGLDLFNGPTSAAFIGYELLNSIGPIDGNGQLLQWAYFAVITNGGALSFDDGISDATFQAVVEVGVPEPATFSLLGAALIGIGLSRRRKRTAYSSTQSPAGNRCCER